MSSRKLEEAKQVIIVRKDLKMSPGKLAAQSSHASLGALFSIAQHTEDNCTIHYDSSAVREWITGRFTKVVVYVKSEEALVNVYNKALAAGLPCALIEDAGFTEFSEPTKTCVGIGPAYPDDFIGVTNKLRLLSGEVIYN